MKLPKMTPWISGKINPIREGWYLVQRPLFGIYADESMKYWNGRNWTWKKKGSYIWGGVIRWKGLSSDPSKAKEGK